LEHSVLRLTVYPPRLNSDALMRALRVHGTAGCIGGGAVRRPPLRTQGESGWQAAASSAAGSGLLGARRRAAFGGSAAPRASPPRRRRASSVRTMLLRRARFSAEAMRESQRR